MKQQTRATAADQGGGFEQYRRPTKRDVFLATMEEILPWQELCAVIEPHYPKPGNGRPPVGLERMLRFLRARWSKVRRSTVVSRSGADMRRSSATSARPDVLLPRRARQSIADFSSDITLRTLRTPQSGMRSRSPDTQEIMMQQTIKRPQLFCPKHRGGIELVQARFGRHACEPHVHSGFALTAVEEGGHRVRYQGAERVAPTGSLVLMNPDMLHSGRSETDEGWRCQMLHIEPEVVEQITGVQGWCFSEAVEYVPQRARQVAALLKALWQAREPLAFDGLMSKVLETLHPHVHAARMPRTEGRLRFAPVVEFLRAHLADRLTLEDLAAVMDLSPFHFLRCFKAQYGGTPHQLLMALRMHEARRRLATGEALAQIATAVGMADQAHLTRAFRQRYGITPGRYQARMVGN